MLSCVMSDWFLQRACSNLSLKREPNKEAMVLVRSTRAANSSLPLQDPGEAAAHLDEAQSRLLHAISFARGDPAPMCALGEVCSLQAEHSLQQDPADTAGATAQLQAALEQGYGAALRIDRACPDALVGVAEVHALLGKMAATAGGLHKIA